MPFTSLSSARLVGRRRARVAQGLVGTARVCRLARGEVTGAGRATPRTTKDSAAVSSTTAAGGRRGGRVGCRPLGGVTTRAWGSGACRHSSTNGDGPPPGTTYTSGSAPGDGDVEHATLLLDIRGQTVRELIGRRLVHDHHWPFLALDPVHRRQGDTIGVCQGRRSCGTQPRLELAGSDCSMANCATAVRSSLCAARFIPRRWVSSVDSVEAIPIESCNLARIDAVGAPDVASCRSISMSAAKASTSLGFAVAC